MTAWIKWFELAAALAAIINWRRVSSNKFIKLLALLLMFITAVEFVGYAIKFYKRYNTQFYNFLIEPGIFILYATAFYNGFLEKNNKKIAIKGSIVVLIIYGLTLFTVDTNKFLNIPGYTGGALFISLLAILKLIEIIKTDDPDFFKRPLVYLLLTIMFYYMTTIPHFAVAYYFYIHKIKNNATVFLASINIIFNYALYFSYMITFFLWDRKTQ
jgi:hypothetical protein